MKKSEWKYLTRSLTRANSHEFMTLSFTISDEAFILLVLINYEKRWKSEVDAEKKEKKRKLVCVFAKSNAIIIKKLTMEFLQNQESSDEVEESDNQLRVGSGGMPVSWKWSRQAQFGTQIAY